MMNATLVKDEKDRFRFEYLLRYLHYSLTYAHREGR